MNVSKSEADPPKIKPSTAPLETDLTADDTIDKQLAADLATSEEPNLLEPRGGKRTH
jgi:hypothetical protein